MGNTNRKSKYQAPKGEEESVQKEQNQKGKKPTKKKQFWNKNQNKHSLLPSQRQQIKPILAGRREIPIFDPLAFQKQKLRRSSKLVGLNLNYIITQRLTKNQLQKLYLPFGYCKSLPALALKVHSSNRFNTTRQIIKQLSRIKSLSSLNLNLDTSNRMESSCFKYLRSDFSSLNSLSRLRISLAKFENLDQKVIIDLSNSLKPLVNLKHVELSFREAHMPRGTSIKELPFAMSRLPRLHSLFLDFSNIAGFGDNPLPLKNLPLQKLQLHFINCNGIADYAVVCLSQSLSCQSQTLQSLILSFRHCNRIGNLGMQRLGSCIASLKKLCNLQLIFQSSDFGDDDGVAALCLGIQSLPQLSTLNLEISFFFSITLKSVENLAECMKKLVALKEFCLILDFCRIISSHKVRISGVKRYSVFDYNFYFAQADEKIEAIKQTFTKSSGESKDFSSH